MIVFIFKIRTRQIGHRLHCVAQCKKAQTCEQGEKTFFTFKTNIALQQ